MKALLIAMLALMGFMLYQIHNLQEERAATPQIYVVDWAGIANITAYSSPEETAKAMEITKQVIASLSERGALVVDMSSVFTAPPSMIIGVQQIKEILQDHPKPSLPQGSLEKIIR